MTQIFEKVQPKPKSKPKMLTVFGKSKTFIERGFHRDKNLKDVDLKEGSQKDNYYENNKYLSIITDTVLGEDYYKYFKQFSEMETCEPSLSDNSRIITPGMLNDVTDSVNTVDPVSVKVEEIEKEFQENVGCGLYLKMKREILKSLRNRIHPNSR